MKTLIALFGLCVACLCHAQNYPTPQAGVWVAKNFRFHTGEVMPSLNIGYTTLGNPAGETVVILHGTTGTGVGMLNTAFGAHGADPFDDPFCRAPLGGRSPLGALLVGAASLAFALFVRAFAWCSACVLRVMVILSDGILALGNCQPRDVDAASWGPFGAVRLQA
jgi:hypothetical protein